jgi:hypothetical protein
MLAGFFRVMNGFNACRKMRLRFRESQDDGDELFGLNLD